MRGRRASLLRRDQEPPATKALADRFDHIVLTINDIDETVRFYEPGSRF